MKARPLSGPTATELHARALAGDALRFEQTPRGLTVTLDADRRDLLNLAGRDPGDEPMPEPRP